MAEFAATIAGLATTADVIVRRLYKYIREVRDAKSEVLELCEQVSSLSGTLHRVSIVLSEFELDGDDRAVSGDRILACVRVLEKLRERLPKFDTVEKVSVFDKRRLKWPFTKPETIELRDDVNARIQDFSLALATDNFSMLLALKDQTATINHKLEQYIEAQHKIKLEDDKLKILNSVSTHDPSWQQRTTIEMHHPGTCVWFLEGQFKTWLASENDKIWVYAIAGAGKSVLASLAIASTLKASVKGQAVVYFYCDYKDPFTQVPLNILRSIVQQLAVQDDRAFGKLEHSVSKVSSTKGCLQLITDMVVHFDNVALLIDGLDECQSNTAEVTGILARLSSTSTNVKCMFFSRELVEIRDQLEAFTEESIAAESTDLRLYVAAEIENRMSRKSVKRLYLRDSNLKDLIIDTLIDRAQGMFRWVALQLDYLSEQPSDNAVRKALGSLPPGINESYERLLFEVNKKPPNVQNLVCRALKWIIWEGDRTEMTAEALCEAVTVDSENEYDPLDVPDQDFILRHCGSFIRLNASGSFELAHFTVREYLTGIQSDEPKLEKYRLDKSEDNLYLAKVIVQYLCIDQLRIPHTNSAEIRDHFGKFAFLQVATMMLISQLQSVEPDNHLIQLLQSFFDSKSTVFRSWCLLSFWLCHNSRLLYDYDFDNRRDPFDDIFARAETIMPIHVTSLCGLHITTQWLLSNKANVNQASFAGTPIQWALTCAETFQWYEWYAGLTGQSYYGKQLSESCASAKCKTIDILLEAGAQVNTSSISAYDSHNVTSRLAAIFMNAVGSTVYFEKLLDRGMQIDRGCMSMILNDMDEKLQQEVFDLIQQHDDKTVPSELLTELTLKQVTRNDGQHDLSKIIAKASSGLDDTTLFFRAIKNGWTSIVSQLLQEGKVHADVCDDEGIPAIIHAARTRRLELCQTLCDHHALVNVCSQKDGVSALQAALSTMSTQYDIELIDFLLKNGASTTHIDNTGKSIWHHAVSGGWIESFKSLAAASNLPDALNIQDSEGNTPLHESFTDLYIGVSEWLLEAGADFALENNERVTPLHLAAYNCDLTSFSDMVNRGADVHHVSNDGLDALGYAITAKDSLSVDIIEFLFKFEPSIFDKRGGSSALATMKESVGSYLNMMLKISDEVLATPVGDMLLDVVLSCDYFYSLECQCLYRLMKLVDLAGRERAFAEAIANALQNLNTDESSYWDRTGNDYGYGYGYELTNDVSMIIETVSEHILSMVPDFSPKPILNYLIGAGKSCVGLIRTVLERNVSPDLCDSDGQSALSLAITKRIDLDIFKELLAASKTSKSWNSRGAGLLHYAASMRTPEHLKLLIDMGFDINKPDWDGATPIDTACMYGQAENVKLLKQADADLGFDNQQKWDSLANAASNGHLDCMMILEPADKWHLHVYKIWVDVNGDKETKLVKGRLSHIAATNGKRDIIKLLLEDTTGFSHSEMADDLSLLALAVSFNHQNVVEYLLENSCTKSVTSSKLTELHLAAIHASAEIIALLIKDGFDINQPDGNGTTPSHTIQTFRSVSIEKSLKQILGEKVFDIQVDASTGPAKADADSKLDQKMLQKKLDYAIGRNDLKMVKAHLKQGGRADLDDKASPGYMFLQYALKNNREDMALLLIQRGAKLDWEVIGDTTDRGYNALHYCAANGMIRTARELLKTCPELLFKDTEVHPIYIAIGYEKFEFLTFLLDEQDFARKAIVNKKAGAKGKIQLPSAHNTDILLIPTAQAISHDWDCGKYRFDSTIYFASPLHFASVLQSTDAARCLLDRGAPVDYEIVDDDITALCTALKTVPINSDMVRLLIDRGASTACYDYSGMPLQLFLTAQFTKEELAGMGLDMDHFDFRYFAETPTGELLLPYNLNAEIYKQGMMRFLPPFAVIGRWEPKGKHRLESCWTSSQLQTLVLNSGIDIDQWDANWGSVLHVNWYSDQRALLKRILRKIGRDRAVRLLNSKPAFGTTPLYLSAAWGRKGITDVLLRYLPELDIDIHAGPHGSALMAAAAWGRLRTVKALVQAGAAITYKDSTGRTISAVAKAARFPRVVRWLLVDRWTERKCICWA